MANEMIEQNSGGADSTAGEPMNWRVCWEIDIEAASARDAAVHALHILRDTDPANTAVVFSCTDPSGDTTVVDLLEQRDDG